MYPWSPSAPCTATTDREGHCSIGTTAPASDYYLAEGTSAWGFTTYVLVQNPNQRCNQCQRHLHDRYRARSHTQPSPARQLAQDHKGERRPSQQGLLNEGTRLQAHNRRARHVLELISTERPATTLWGSPLPMTTFYCPDGQSSSGRETWTLVQNPNSTPSPLKSPT